MSQTVFEGRTNTVMSTKRLVSESKYTFFEKRFSWENKTYKLLPNIRYLEERLYNITLMSVERLFVGVNIQFLREEVLNYTHEQKEVVPMESIVNL